ncbi:hypothetical protein Lesp02_84350 [Lentzea sp. NBRC 105346]|uniref:hypothetical protein n=1 Tax=Lentzea sp. NBRC 105346 TaxID=3032205 RepID=UPI0024A01D24|nr:hypothetical protein [Lentzea sp. NBRC 105346]GLZ36248.1 hypothetical protein Lesp02_84350 [Lentzea sp. NBRC 105346]
MTEPMIAEEQPRTSNWFTPASGVLNSPEPAAEAVDEPVDVEPAEQVEALDPDPLSDVEVGSTFIAPSEKDPRCGAHGEDGVVCVRRPHPPQWRHFAIVDYRVVAAWPASPAAAEDVPSIGRHRTGVAVTDLLAPATLPADPLGHVRVDDPDPLADIDGELCRATGPTVFDLAGREIRNVCDRAPHPAHWQHIAVDVDEVVEVWVSDPADEPAEQPVTPGDRADVVDAVEQKIELGDGVALEEVDESFDERAEHVLRADTASRTVLRGMLDERRRERVAAVFTEYGVLSPDLIASLPTRLIVALERAVCALGEPIPPVEPVEPIAVAAGGAR